MIIGKEGQNIQWVIDRFKVYYAQTYKKQCDAFVEVKIQKKTNQKIFLKEQTMFDEETQKRFYKQKIAVIEEHLHAEGKFSEDNMMEWKQFLEK